MPIRMMPPPWRDVVAIVLLAMLGGTLAWMLVHQAGSVFFYQMFMPEALMWACGHGFRHPLALSAGMVDFLLNRSVPGFDCASIAADATTGPPGFFFNSQLYLGWIVAGLWRLFGPTQLAIGPLATLLFAGFSAATYMLARLFLNRLLSVLAALALTLSPVTIGMVFMLRDFSKAPFFLWGIALLVLTARAATPRRALPLALAAGAIVGIGTGFRTDLAILAPFGMGFLAIAGNPNLLRRAVPLAAYALSFLVLAAPMLTLGNSGNLGFLIMEGAAEPFRAFLALRPAPYALGNAYADEPTLSAITAIERPRHPDWDAREPPPIYGFTQALAYSTDNLREWAPNFAADFAAQALKGTGWILGYPELVAVSRGDSTPGSPMRLDLPLVRWLEQFYAVFAQPWMPVLGFLGMLALLLRVAARDGREALALAALFLALTGYPAIQFGLRHVFHLEFIWVLSVLSLPMALRETRRLLPVVPRFALAATAILGAMVLAYVGLARFQQHRLTAEFAALLALPRTPVALTREPQEHNAVLLRVPVPAADLALVEGAPDSLNVRISVTGIPNDVRAAGERMLLTLGGDACAAGPVTLGLRYDHRPGVWQKLDRTLQARAGDIVIFPAFYRATQNLAGIVLPASHAACEVSVFRLPLTDGLPLVMTAELPPDWHALPLRKGLGRFDAGPQR